MMSFTRRLLAGAFSVLFSLPAFAALPESGMWVVGDEVNGKPGRGIQVDIQGKSLILTYFGYRADGTATFLQASGQLQNNKDFAGNLVEFKNGRALGGDSRDGEVARVAGQISVSFDTPTKGVVSLPGEAPQSVSRFKFEDTRGRLQNDFAAVIVDSRAYLRRSYLTIKIEGDTLKIEQMSESTPPSTCTFSGSFFQAGNGYSSDGTVQCNYSYVPPRYKIENLQVDDFGMISGRLYYYELDGALFSEADIIGVCQGGGQAFGFPLRCSPRQLGLN